MPSSGIVDCRWYGRGGAGRATELFLEGLSDASPPQWLRLWGSPDLRRYAPMLPLRPARAANPRALFGQAGWREVPAGAVVLFMHQMRPLRRGPSVTLIHDVIPLHHACSRYERKAKEAYFRCIARSSAVILTVSEASATRIAERLCVSRDRIKVVSYPSETSFIRAVRTARARVRGGTGSRPFVLYVGRYGRHKNIERLAAAFYETRFCAGGGKCILVGAERSELERHGVAVVGGTVEARGHLSDVELAQAYARASAVVLPSLEEGFGFPAWEAVCAGIPAVVGDVAALPEVARDHVVVCEPTSADAIAAAIDDAVMRGGHEPVRGTSAASFTREMIDAIEGVR